MSDPPEEPAESEAEEKAPAEAKEPRKFGSRRGVETMFRTSYREQLDLTALADKKANIMISVNGLIMSMTFAFGGVIIGSKPWLVTPFGALATTALVSIFFDTPVWASKGI